MKSARIQVGCNRSRLLMVLIVACAVSFSFLVPSHVANAAPPTSPTFTVAGCKVTLTFTGAAGASYDLKVWDDGVVVASASGTGTGGDLSLSVMLEASPAKGAVGVGIGLYENGGQTFYVDPYYSACPAMQFYDPGDERVNADPGIPAALYCVEGGIHVYAVNPDDSTGKLVLIVSKTEIAKVVNAKPTVNTLIKQTPDGKLRIFYLPATKEFSLVTTDLRPPYKPYQYIWEGCS